ncbi:MAG TPA: LLM class flavin-dependent oxidoreductase [Pseudolysinimonas sp.]|nr:LLM class flavin-dependent oxidoreductase [Pseudolysinimonas sp.]
MAHLEFHATCDVSYTALPALADGQTLTIDLPTTYGRPERSRRVLDEILQTVQLLERLGFDGATLTEQHGGAVGIVGNALQAAAWVAGQTSGIRINAVGPILNAYLSPVRMAEEVAFADLVSRGRLSVGLPLGVGSQYHSYGIPNPAQARSRHREAHDLFIRALTDDGPFAWNGDHFHVPHVNLWPKPVQTPHPPIWIPAAGSRESLELAAENHYVYQTVFVPWDLLLKNTELFRQLCRNHGYEPPREQIAAFFQVYVAETDEQARREYEPMLLWQYQNVFSHPFADSFPPGYQSEAGLRGVLGGGYRSEDADPAKMTWERLIEENWLVAGSPETVRKRLLDLTDQLGAGAVVLDTSSLPLWQKEKSLTLLAEEVIPAFRAPDGAPIWSRTPPVGHSNIVEAVAREGGTLGRPSVTLPDLGTVDAFTAPTMARPS